MAVAMNQRPATCGGRKYQPQPARGTTPARPGVQCADYDGRWREQLLEGELARLRGENAALKAAASPGEGGWVPQCKMTERVADGECQRCQDGHVQSADGADCVKTGVFKLRNGKPVYGTYVNGKMEGKLSWDDGAKTYYGYHKAGQRAGFGVIAFAGSGNRYRGEWKADQMHGKGVYAFASGKTYTGDLVQNKFTGQGVMRWPDGTEIAGGFKNDEAHGIATKTWADGSSYRGQWDAGFMAGQGTRYYSNGSVYKGQWARDKRQGRGVLTEAGGATKSGRWANDQFRG